MNRERIEYFIKVMQDVQELDNYQNHEHFSINTWAMDLNSNGTATCRTVACALGWLAMTSYARRRGLVFKKAATMAAADIPVYRNQGGVGAGALFLGIDRNIAYDLFLNTNEENIGPQLIIDKLQFLLDLGEQPYLDMLEGDLNDLP